MIKKISAIVLALVLCLSVVVMPASAMDLGNALLGYEIKLDKEYYNPGDTAIVSVYVNAAEGYELGTFLFSIGVNSDVFTQADNPATDIKASAINNSALEMLYKPVGDLGWAWASAGQISAISGSDSAEEKAYYNGYLRITGSRNAQSSIGNKNGLPTEDLNADDAPFIQFELKVSETVAEGTPVKVAVTSGAIAKAQTYFNYYKNPGNATTIAKFAAADSVSFAAEAVVGQPAPTYPDFTIGAGKDAIRFEKNADKTYANKVSIRTMAKLDAATLQAAVGATENDAVEAYIVEAGFVFAPSTTAFDAAVAKTVAEGATVAGYEKKNVSYIQNDGTSYNFTCLIEVQDADIATADFNTYAFIGLDFDKDGTADKYYFSADKDAISSKALFNAKCEAAWAQYGWGTPTKK